LGLAANGVINDGLLVLAVLTAELVGVRVLPLAISRQFVTTL